MCFIQQTQVNFLDFLKGRKQTLLFLRIYLAVVIFPVFLRQRGTVTTATQRKPGLSKNKNFERWSQGGELSVRLCCFPHAGAGPGIFSDWVNRLPEGTEVCGVRYAGREWLLSESPHQNMQTLTDDLFVKLKDLFDQPTIFFGHSMGALVAFELAKKLRKERMGYPIKLIVSGRTSPCAKPNSEVFPDASDNGLLNSLRRLGGTPEDVLNSDAFTEMVLPALRSDLKLMANYKFRPVLPLPIETVALAGAEDPTVSQSQLKAWSNHTLGSFSLETFPGGHFYLDEAEPKSKLLMAMSHEITKSAPTVRVTQHSPDQRFKFEANEVHVWRLRLDAEHFDVDKLVDGLSEVEQKRVEGFRFPDLRRRFIVRRTLLRRLLSRYLNVAETSILLKTDSNGKPLCENRFSNKANGKNEEQQKLFFNTSHSAGFGLVALAKFDLGVDLEQIRPIQDLELMISKTLNPDERHKLNSLPLAQRTISFYNYWTAKESLLKATGEGLIQQPFESVDLSHLDLTSEITKSNFGVIKWKGAIWGMQSFRPFFSFSATLTTPGSVAPKIHFFNEEQID